MYKPSHSTHLPWKLNINIKQNQFPNPLKTHPKPPTATAPTTPKNPFHDTGTVTVTVLSPRNPTRTALDTTKPYSWFIHKLAPRPKKVMEKKGRLVFYRQHEKGGHFAALEWPAEFLQDIQDFMEAVLKERARRIKCDENKPSCLRCTSSQRTCTYTPPNGKPPRPRFRVVVYTAPRPSPSPNLSLATNPQEREALEFFVRESCDRFPLDFSHAVLRAAGEEPVLASAIMSFGALQRVFEFDKVKRRATDKWTERMRFATQHYGKALRMLQSRARNQTHDVTLICSVLFACFECLRGCRRAAMIHIASGLNLLRQVEETAGTDTWGIMSRGTIRGLFTRLDSQLVEILGIGVGETLKKNGIRAPKAMVSALHADAESERVDMHGLLDELLNAILREKLDSLVEMQGLGAASTSTMLLSALNTWHSRFDHSDSDLKKWSLETNDDDVILRIWYLIGKMYLTIRPSDPETAWDRFSGEFETILSLCEIYISESRKKRAPRNHTFAFSLGVVPPLFITAQRCRNACIRRRAIHLLSTCERREIFWDSALAAEAAQRIIEIEESATFDTETQQPVDMRVRNLTAVLDDEDGAKILLQ
ncbi:uncharacterized protein KD926_000446 [Aspergillus affinis]|uniref:uncharacterized protein n=1 Tax=Aspergillus affinis TaxID=1070780 RepID=UPI0022FE4692|nr:uncharacterized protein KD926_000446 [Aspergillus affinis]KAI9044535.1 hypothetical protein KD926_000446 [Aspergillus affinis]